MIVVSDAVIKTAAHVLMAWLKTYEIADIEFELACDIVDVVIKSIELSEQIESDLRKL